MLSFDGLTEHMCSLPFKKETCQSLLNHVSAIVKGSEANGLTLKEENEITYILELILLREDGITNGLDLDGLFALV